MRLRTGYAAPRGSRRVAEVQRRLARRGYRPGPLDGRFGPRTRDAVRWFQIKHGFRSSGTVDVRTLAALRTTAAPRATRTASPVEGVTPARTSLAPTVQARRSSSLTNALAWGGLALVIGLGLALIALWVREELRAPAEPTENPVRHLAVAPDPGHTIVLGYVALEREDAHERLDAATRAIGTWCEQREWQLRRVIHDVDHGGNRPGLAYVLEQIRDGHARGVVVARLRDITESVTRIGRLLEWLNDADAFLIALDLSLDTSRPSGRVAARALADVSEWERSRIASRNRRGLDAAGVRPTVSDDPELHEQIVAMRRSGMSLQAIADTLNAAGVPTVRGGGQWRPSSVQTATGYKRPPAHSGEFPRLRRVDNEAPD